MFDTICLCLICILSIYIAATLLIYSRSGDLNNSLKGMDKLYKLGDKDEIIKQLYELVVFQKSRVVWPFLLAISIVFAIFISYATKLVEEQSQRFIIIIPFIFLPLYVSFNYMQAHGGNNTLSSANQLFAINRTNKFQNNK